MMTRYKCGGMVRLDVVEVSQGCWDGYLLIQGMRGHHMLHGTSEFGVVAAAQARVASIAQGLAGIAALEWDQVSCPQKPEASR